MMIRKININVTLVSNLIAEQFPQYSNLTIQPVEYSGIDNRTFRLGDDMLIRLPSAEAYAAQVSKEQTWLATLAPHLPVKIPQALHMGSPNQHYPWHWSIYQWLTGTSANQLILNDATLAMIAKDLAKFIKTLHTIPTQHAPEGGAHNYYRGCHPSVYDENARSDIENLRHIIDANKALNVWEKAMSSTWPSDLVWVHGDIASGNILILNDTLAAVIDFGCMAIGDPACDLVIAWTFFTGEARKIF